MSITIKKYIIAFLKGLINVREKWLEESGMRNANQADKI